MNTIAECKLKTLPPEPMDRGLRNMLEEAKKEIARRLSQPKTK